MKLKLNLAKYKLHLFGLLVAFMPWSITLTSIATILLLLITVLEAEFTKKIKSLAQAPALLLLACLLLVYAISILYSSDKAAGAFGIEKKLSLLVFPLILAGYKHNVKSWNVVSFMFVASISVASLYCLGYAFYRNYAVGEPATLPYSFSENFGIQNTFGLYWDYFSYSELARPLKLHPTYFSIYTVFAAFILGYKLVRNQSNRRLNQSIAVFLIILLLITTLLLSSRIIIFGSGVVIFVFFILHVWQNGLRKQQALLLGGVTLLILLLLMSLPVTRYRLFTETKNLFISNNPSVETGVSQRSLIWSATTQEISDNLWLGVGIGDVQHILNESYVIRKRPELLNLNTHNQFLQTFLGLGIVGLTLLMIIFIYPLCLAVISKSIIPISFLIIVLTTCLTEAILESNKGIVFFSFFYCYFFSGKEITIKET